MLVLTQCIISLAYPPVHTFIDNLPPTSLLIYIFAFFPQSHSLITSLSSFISNSLFSPSLLSPAFLSYTHYYFFSFAAILLHSS